MQTVKQILRRHNIRSMDDLELSRNSYGSQLFEDLYNYYLFSGDMPYGIAKARTGDPFEWVYQRAADILDG